MRTILFISHANPQDNGFTMWLASRLQLMGYRVWCDVEGLIGGEKQWEVIDNVIRNDAGKFLLVVSKDMIIQPGKLKDGISKEFHLAEAVAKKLGTDFIVPLKIDKAVSHDDFIGLNRYNHIEFSDNWAPGLKDLVKKLEKDKVPTVKPRENKTMTGWYENEFTTKYGMIEKKESYLTNWWPIEEIEETFEIYQYENEKQAEEIRKINNLIPVIQHGNTIATFGNAEVKINGTSPIGDYEIAPIDKINVNTMDILKGIYTSDTFPTLTDCENILKRLLGRAFHLMVKEKGFYWYELASKRNCYYYPLGRKDKASFESSTGKKTRNLVGRYKINDEISGHWHFGISSKVMLAPVLGYSLKSHILFSDDGRFIWSSKERLHSARRRKGKRWFNEEWRDLLLAFINSLKDSEEKIQIKLSNECDIDMPDKTIGFSSDVGYVEPVSKGRESILEEQLEEELKPSEKGEEDVA